jgi:hypothetical protein
MGVSFLGSRVMACAGGDQGNRDVVGVYEDRERVEQAGKLFFHPLVVEVLVWDEAERRVFAHGLPVSFSLIGARRECRYE